jgi:FkbM family methyltransferase
MLASKTIQLITGSVTITARADDGYFHNAEHHAQELFPLAALARGSAGADTILDVGGNIGLSCMTLALACPDNKVVVFEPSPSSAELLRKNLSQNEILNVSVIQAAVSNVSGRVKLNEGITSGFSHILTEGYLGGSQSGTTEVPVYVLDDFIHDKISFVKIDVEGHEPNVICGMKRLIETHNPLIYMEFNPWCLSAFGGYNIAAFSRGIFETFEVYLLNNNGELSGIGTNAIGFVYKSLVERTISDIAIKLQIGKTVPTLEGLTLPPDLYSELCSLREMCNTKLEKP